MQVRPEHPSECRLDTASGTPVKLRGCTKCGEEKPDEAFARRTDSGHLHSWCKSCKYKYDLDYEQRNPASRRPRARRYEANHKEERNTEKRRRYRRECWETLGRQGISREARKVLTLPEELRRLTLRIDRMIRLGVKEMMEESESAASKFGAPGLQMPVLLKDLLAIRDMRAAELRRCAATVERFDKLQKEFGTPTKETRRKAA